MAVESRYGPGSGSLLNASGNNPEITERSKLLLYDNQYDPHLRIRDETGRNRYVTIVPLAEKRWLYGISVPEYTVLSTVQAETIRMILLAILVAVISLIVAMIVARGISSPIRSVAAAADQLAHGNLKRRVKLDRKDEIGQLASSFDAMADSILANQQELKHYAEQLKTRAIERTEALRETEERYRQSQKMEAIGKLAGGVAHDFNNLLTVVLNYSAMLKKLLVGNEHMQNMVEEIKKAAERAAALTRQLLAFSRRQILQPVPLDLNVAVLEMDKMMQRLIGEDIELISALQPRLDLILADPGQVSQVLLNLIVNSRDAMPEGGKMRIETANVMLDENSVPAQSSLKPGPHVSLTLIDSGCGMDEATQLQMFEPFFTTKKNGTGLGLSTVYGIVRQSEGDIFVESRQGEGTTMKILFPRTIKSEISEPPPQAVPAPSGNETIILVEDETSLRRLTAAILRKTGFRVIEAANGVEGVTKLQELQGKLDIVVTDVVMPLMGGVDFAKYVANMRPGTPVIFTSGYTDDAVAKHGILQAGIEFLQKPYEADSLISRIREVLDQSRKGSRP
jgi:signal transduction histidine kinase/ActR/RegA family two-component response regulator